MTLTDEQLKELDGLWLGAFAVTEIGELRESLAVSMADEEIMEKMAIDNARLRKALEPIEFCAEARGDHWCPSCCGNKQEGTPTRGHYAHCPIYLALKDPK